MNSGGSGWGRARKIHCKLCVLWCINIYRVIHKNFWNTSEFLKMHCHLDYENNFSTKIHIFFSIFGFLWWQYRISKYACAPKKEPNCVPRGITWVAENKTLFFFVWTATAVSRSSFLNCSNSWCKGQRNRNILSNCAFAPTCQKWVGFTTELYLEGRLEATNIHKPNNENWINDLL